MGKRHVYTYDEIKQEFEERGYTLITNHKLKCDEKYEYICNKHVDKGSQFIDWGHFHSSHRGCYYCGREKTETARRKDLSEYDGKSLAESKGFEYVGMTRHDSKVWVEFICPNHREYGVQEMPYFNMQRVVAGCQHCIGRNDSEEHVLQEMRDGNEHIILLEPYTGRTKRTKMLCTKHNNIIYTTPNNVIHDKACYYCGIEKLSEFNKIPESEFCRRLKENGYNISVVCGYDGITSIVTVRCNDCGYEWSNQANYILSTGCPCCNNNSTEFKLGEIIRSHGFKCIPQFSLDDCRDIRPLPFDFYLPEINALVEYDGEGHYMPVRFGGMSDEEAEEHFIYIQKHDDIKNKYCAENDIPLIRVPYWEKNNLEQYIMDRLQQYVLTN